MNKEKMRVEKKHSGVTGVALRLMSVLMVSVSLALICAFFSFAGDGSAAASSASQYASVKIYSEDSSHGKVVNGGALTVDSDASVTSLGNRINISGVKDYIYAVPGDGYVFDGWQNVPSDNRVKEDAVILAKFKPVGLETTKTVTASVAKDSSGAGTIAPTSSIKVLTNSEVQVRGSTVLIAKEAFSAIPKSGKIFSHWEGLPEDGIIHGDTAITAVFETPENPVTVSFVIPATGGDYVSTTGSNEVLIASGSEITVTEAQICLGDKEYVRAIPYSDYDFNGWAGLPDDGIINEDTSITATFKPKTVASYSYNYSEADGESFHSEQVIGSMDDPVDDGLWVRDNDASWTYEWHVPMANTWGCLDNPYALETQPQHGWFFFDKSGRMLTGWHLIDNKWYYFEPVSECKGQLYSSAATPDSFEFDETSETGVRVDEK